MIFPTSDNFDSGQWRIIYWNLRWRPRHKPDQQNPQVPKVSLSYVQKPMQLMPLA